MGGIGNMILNTVVRSLTRKDVGKATKSAGSLVGKKGKKGAAKGKAVSKPHR